MFIAKKTSVYFLILCITVSMLLAGCGEKEVGGPEGSVTLNWLMLGPGKQKDSDAVWEAFNEKLQEKLPNTTVEIECLQRAEFVEKWKLKVASQEKMDLAWTGWLIDYSEEVQKGAYTPLDELIDKYAPHLREELPEFLFQQATVDGKIYSIPNYQMVAGMRNGIRTHKELADKYWDTEKVQEVFYKSDTMTEECYDIIEGYLQKLKENNEIRKGVSTQTFAWLAAKGFEPVSEPFVVRMGDESFKVINKYETPEYKLLYSKMADWFSKGYIRADILSLQDPRQDEGTKDGYVIWVHNYFRDSAEGETNKAKFPVTVIPCGEHYYIAGGASATATAIPRVSKYPERAMQLLGLIQSDEGEDLFDMLVLGIEGQHYEKIAENKVRTIGYRGQPDNTAPYGLWKWVVGNTFKGYLTEGQSDDYNDYIQKEVNEKAIVLPLVGFKPNLKSLSTEKAQLSTVVKEYENTLISGVMSNYEEQYDAFIQKMKNAGSDKIAQQLQVQVDEYVKQNNIKINE